MGDPDREGIGDWVLEGDPALKGAGVVWLFVGEPDRVDFEGDTDPGREEVVDWAEVEDLEVVLPFEEREEVKGAGSVKWCKRGLMGGELGGGIEDEDDELLEGGTEEEAEE